MSSTSINWNEDKRVGYESSTSFSTPVYSRLEGVGRFAIHVADFVFRQTYDLSHGDAKTQKQVSATAVRDQGMLSDHLWKIRPKLSEAETDKIRLRAAEELIPLLLKDIQRRTKPDRGVSIAPALPNGLFLAALGAAGRNYKRDCALCLEDIIMGTTCGCGHTEIVVFRNCGHSVCANPCFQKLLGDREFPETEFTTPDGSIFTIPSKPNLNHVSGFNCPICRQAVHNTFRAEDVRADSGGHLVARKWATRILQ